MFIPPGFENSKYLVPPRSLRKSTVKLACRKFVGNNQSSTESTVMHGVYRHLAYTVAASNPHIIVPIPRDRVPK
jgi:hypothetical protein